MRQNQFSDWLTDFTNENCKKVEASYLDALKQLIEHKSKQKYGTIDDALNDFCSRMNIDRIATDIVRAAALDSNKHTAVLASLRLAVDVKEIEKDLRQGVPAEAIANEHGNDSEEKNAIKEYVTSKEQDQRDERSQIVRDMGRSEDQKVTPTSAPSLPKMSSLRRLSKHAEQYMSPEESQKAQTFINTFVGLGDDSMKNYSIYIDGQFVATYAARNEEEAIFQWEEDTLLDRKNYNIEARVK